MTRRTRRPHSGWSRSGCRDCRMRYRKRSRTPTARASECRLHRAGAAGSPVAGRGRDSRAHARRYRPRPVRPRRTARSSKGYRRAPARHRGRQARAGKPARPAPEPRPDCHRPPRSWRGGEAGRHRRVLRQAGCAAIAVLPQSRSRNAQPRRLPPVRCAFRAVAGRPAAPP